MSGKTNVASGSPNAQYVQAAALFTQAMQRRSILNTMVGQAPQGEGQAAAAITKQTAVSMPFVRMVDLTRGKGDEVEFQFLQPYGAYPIMGSETAEGKGGGLKLDKGRVRVNQARFPLDLGDTMTDLRSPVDFRRVGRPIAKDQMESYLDQSMLVHAAGARGYHDSIEWRVPLDSDPKFSEILVNPVKAPTKNRHFVVDGGDIKPFALSSTDVDIAPTDLLTMDVVDAIRNVRDSMKLPPNRVIVPNDEASDNEELQLLLVSPAQYNEFAADKDFRQFQAAAYNRTAKSGNHPLFKASVGLWNNILILKMPKPIRFYAGDTIKYCASNTSETESSATVPASFSTTHAIDRALLLGGQAVAQAFGRSKHGGMPFFWKEKTFDHDDKMEILLGTITGLQKLRWLVDQGDGTSHYTDHGVIAIDTAVKVPLGGRN